MPISTLTKGIEIFFTFQSGYIQICILTMARSEMVKLYIPIWLYSNGTSFLYKIPLPIFTFQSGYIQIIPFVHDFKNPLLLYIPIWLYSNTDCAMLSGQWLQLYIPIWLYSNRLKNLS